jgi:phage shock protein PspC (stress-responsive transcriptional regulator)
MGKLYRSNDRVIAGVCAGVAEHFGWDVRTVRLIWLVLAIFGAGCPVLFYLILLFLMPNQDTGLSYEQRMRNRLGK